MPDPSQITSKGTVSACPECGKPSEALVLGGKAYPQHCDKCIAGFEADARRDRKVKLTESEAMVEHERAERWREICPPLYQKNDVALFPAAAWRKVSQWAVNPRGLLLAGPTGMCKTRMIWARLRVAVMRGVGVAAFDSIQFGHDCIDAFTSSRGTEWFDALWKVPILFIDDLGKTPATERVESELFGLIEFRIAHQRPILATTNATGAELTDKLSADRGAPMIRRLREFCDLVVCDDKPKERAE